MTVPVPAPPEPTTIKPRVIRQTRRGWVLGWFGATSAGVLPFLLLERAVGLDGRLADQAWIVPVGVLCFLLSGRAYTSMAPRPAQAELIVTPACLDYRDRGSTPVVVARAGIGLVDVIGSADSGQFAVTVHDYESAAIVRWLPRWAGWTPEHVVKVLRAAGYPAARHSDIYDGRFQSQTVGQPPQMAG